MDKKYSIGKLAQLLKTMDVELEDNVNYTVEDIKDILDDYLNKDIKYVLFKHRKIQGRNGYPQVVAAFWYSGQEQTEFDKGKSFTDETNAKKDY